MRHYLATLHKKPDHHKKRFAFMASASFTLAIFAVWSFVNFGLPDMGGDIAEKGAPSIEPLKNGVASAWTAIGSTLDGAKEGIQGLETVHYENDGR